MLESKEDNDFQLEYKTDIDPVTFKEYSGKYRSVNYSNNTVQKVGMLMGFNNEIEVVVSENILIVNHADTLKLLKDGRFLSQNNEQLIAFKKGIDGDRYMINSSGYFEKMSFYDTSSFQLNWIMLVIIIQLLSLFIYTMYAAVKKLRVKNSFKWHARINILTAISKITFVFLLAGATSSVNPWDTPYGILDSVKNILLIPFLTVGLVVINIII